MTAIIVAALLSHADGGLVPFKQSDAPIVLDQTMLMDVRAIGKGDPAPDPGVWMSEDTAVAQARRVRACEEERADLRRAPMWPWIAIPAALLVGAAGGYWLSTRRQ